MLFHIAQRERWAEALATGSYTASTLGRELADVGFIHLSREDQVRGVAQRFYPGVDDLVLLTIDESRLTAPLRWDPVGDDEFPHLYGALDVGAVVDVAPFAP